MAYDEGLAQRLREVFSDRSDIEEKKMFGGIAFVLAGHMCLGINDTMLMARVGPDRYEEAMTRPHAREMDFTGRSMKGFIYVAPEGIAEDEDLKFWTDLCEKFVQSMPPK
ncbi:MAG: TfoX/Sxy family protein [Rhodothermia bacterium]|nr:MAG: TfoX/Sxy family protein [Rhodothermia bacterium]